MWFSFRHLWIASSSACISSAGFSRIRLHSKITLKGRGKPSLEATGFGSVGTIHYIALRGVPVVGIYACTLAFWGVGLILRGMVRD